MARHVMISAWTTYEILLRDADGKLDAAGERPFSNDLAGDGDPVQTAIQKMRLLQHHGWPDARLNLKDKRGKLLIDRADDEDPKIWILKCKPSCWRLYFCVYSDTKRIVYLYAVCKKRPDRDPADSVRARHRFDGFGGSRRSGIARFDFPA